jgi:hypothetical protein
MDIKKSFKRFKKNYIRESEALDNEDFVDVNLEGTTEDTTGKVYTIEVASVITDEDSDAQNVQTYENVTAEELIEKLGEEKANEFFAKGEITVDFPFDDDGFTDGAEEYAWYIESEGGEYDDNIEFTDPEENLDDGYDTDFNESCCGGGKKKDKKKGKKDKKSKFVPFWTKKKDKELKEALKTLKDAGYSIINECGVDCELEDDATGFGIAFDDSDYYTEDGECEVCAICGRESCDGEYDEDGNFVCSDCAENSLEQPMEDIDPMDIYFRAAKADNIRDMNRFVR